jgi:hypothetical protein
MSKKSVCDRFDIIFTGSFAEDGIIHRRKGTLVCNVIDTLARNLIDTIVIS